VKFRNGIVVNWNFKWFVLHSVKGMMRINEAGIAL
jgi:hypothetical protein